MKRENQLVINEPIILETQTPIIELDLGISNLFEILLKNNVTLSFKNAEVGAVYAVIFKQDGTGSRTVTFSNKFIFNADDEKTVKADANSVSMLTGTYSGLAQQLSCTPIKQY
jgi:hypothetical protein